MSSSLAEPAAPPRRATVQGAAGDLVADRWCPTGASRGEVVLLPGGGQTRRSWSRTGARLVARGWSVTAPDLRGHGESSWAADGDYGTDAFVGDLCVLVEALGAPVHLVGASLGGLVALTAAGEHPGLAASLVLVDVVPTVAPAGASRVRDFMAAHPDGFADLAEAVQAVSAYRGRPAPPRAAESLRGNLRTGADGRWYWHWDPAYLPPAGAPPRARDTDRTRRAARSLEVPLLLVHGVRSDVVTPEGLAELHELVPGARVVDVADVGHMVVGDDNDVLVAAVADFLDTAAGPQDGPTGAPPGGAGEDAT